MAPVLMIRMLIVGYVPIEADHAEAHPAAFRNNGLARHNKSRTAGLSNSNPTAPRYGADR
jgi:hypothetical protein